MAACESSLRVDLRPSTSILTTTVTATTTTVDSHRRTSTAVYLG
jgi:hypothetical protein